MATPAYKWQAQTACPQCAEGLFVTNPTFQGVLQRIASLLEEHCLESDCYITIGPIDIETECVEVTRVERTQPDCGGT